MTIATLDIARLASAFGTQAVARVSDDTARAMARSLIESSRAATAQRVAEHAERYVDYSAEDMRRMDTLRSHVWPRSRAVRSAIESADAAARAAHGAHDQSALYDAVLRAHRLTVLASVLDAQSARIGAFPLSFTDSHVSTSRFLRSAAWRRFMFKGGRDVGSREHDNEDVLQGAFLRAIESGHAVFGVPTWGSMFGHVQAERAHLTRIAGAEWYGIRAALFGVKPTRDAYPDTDDKHSMRRLGTRHTSGKPYGTRDTHALAMAIAEHETNVSALNDLVTRDARSLAIVAGDKESFVRVLASVLMDGASIQDVSDAIGIRVSTIRDRVFAERDAAMASGVDHSTDVHETRAAERERDVMHAQREHAEHSVNVRSLAQRADWMRAAIARRRGVSAMDAGRRAALRDNLSDAIADAGARVIATGYAERYDVSAAQRDADMRAVHSGQRAAIPYAGDSSRVMRSVASALVRAANTPLAERYAAHAEFLSARGV